MKNRHLSALGAVLAIAALATPKLDAGEVDCDTAFRPFLPKERRQRAIDCAHDRYDREKKNADSAYSEALKAASSVYEQSQMTEGSERVYRAAVEAAKSSYDESLAEARASRAKTIEFNTKHGVFTYGAGVTALFPSRRVTEARLDANNRVKAVQYADESIRPLVVATYFPRDLTWGIGPRRWGFGPMVAYDVGGLTESLGLGFMVGVTRSGDKEGPLSLGVGVAYYLDTEARSLREDFVVDEEAPRDHMNRHMQPEIVRRTSHSVIVTVTLSFWDRPGS